MRSPFPARESREDWGIVRTSDRHVSRYAALIAGLICIVGFGILAAPSNILARTKAAQDAGQAAPPAVSPAAAPSAPKPVEMPEGDGKPIATEFCQDCHKLTNLTKAHKNLDDWKETVQTMIDRGANVPADKIDILAQYLAKNFGPKDASASVAPSTAAPSSTQ